MSSLSSGFIGCQVEKLGFASMELLDPAYLAVYLAVWARWVVADALIAVALHILAVLKKDYFDFEEKFERLGPVSEAVRKKICQEHHSLQIQLKKGGRCVIDFMTAAKRIHRSVRDRELARLAGRQLVQPANQK